MGQAKQQPIENLNELREEIDMTRAAMVKRLLQGKPVAVGSTNERDMARRFIDTRGRLRSFQKVLYEYHRGKGHYQIVSNVPAALRTFVENLYLDQVETVKGFPEVEGYEDQIVPRSIKSSWLNDVEASLHAAVAVPDDAQVPCWLATEEEDLDGGDEVITISRPLIEPNRKFITTKDRLIDVDEWVNHGRIVEPEPSADEWFSMTRMAHRYNKKAVCPRWEVFLDTIFEGDTELIALMQEWFGYCLIADTRFHKFLLLEGEGANGKSVLVNVLRGLLGDTACSSLGLSSFGKQFDVYSTFGKMLNVSSEASELTPRLEDALKAYTGGDVVSTDRKHKDVFQFRPTARLMVTTNNRPKVSDESGGFWRRMILVPFRYQVPPAEQDPMLATTLLETEAEGILLWAMHGLRRLMTNNQFTEPASSIEAQEEYKQESSQVAQFVKELCFLDEEAEEQVSVVFAAYKQWSFARAESPLEISDFGKSLRRIVSGLKTYQHRVDGKHVRSYRGLCLR
jgi:P4 family phage/plasmid primase-like protien